MSDWSAVGFFCDDIRQEVNNIDSLIGVMPDNVAVPSIPAMLPKLGIYTRIHLAATNTDVKRISVRADFFDGAHYQELGAFDEEAVAFEKENATKKESPIIGFIFRAILSPLPIPKYGRVRLWARINDEEFICGSLNFEPQAGTDASAARSPS
jgi:hypothetical protein